jgi:hypothetical protein
MIDPPCIPLKKGDFEFLLSPLFKGARGIVTPATTDQTTDDSTDSDNGQITACLPDQSVNVNSS